MNRKTLRRLGTAVFLALGLLAAAGCERSQPGPKPISGALDEQAAGTAQPALPVLSA
ncbi:hypothetical protein [Cupriavidus basilensis]|uniref:Uncharacterized protein n=1 Tax=Cupriavidus basilensis TaxID=68895 RepID=A0A0C4YGS5_9BURK|nr:hypothetical protein [Cupriavidus basilensis]AJG25067.1 hypothetical protein RR42_s3491 [Cupriavidus basilensis]